MRLAYGSAFFLKHNPEVREGNKMTLRGLFSAIDISATGLTAQRKRVNAVASNIANVETTRTDEGGPYKKRRVTMHDSSRSFSFKSLMSRVTSKLSITHSSHISSSNSNQSSLKKLPAGVEAEERIVRDIAPKMIYDPVHPDANEDGYVAMPNINIVEEMVDLMTASRAYEANITVMDASKTMMRRALDI